MHTVTPSRGSLTAGMGKTASASTNFTPSSAMGSQKSPKLPEPAPPPPPVSATGTEQATADVEERRRKGKRYTFENTIIAPGTTGRQTLG